MAQVVAQLLIELGEGDLRALYHLQKFISPVKQHAHQPVLLVALAAGAQ
jgi:hypothetical protein